MGGAWAAMDRDHRSGRSLRRAAWVLAAAAAVLAVAGAGSIALQRFEGWSAPDFDVAWERGAILGLSVEDDGYEVTLERAYADAGQVMLSLAVEDLEKRPGTTQLSILDGTLIDDTGARYEPMGGQSGPVDAHEAAEVWYFDPPSFPLEPGPRQFTLSVGRIDVRGDVVVSTTLQPDDAGVVEVADPWAPVAGRWVIEFDLDVAGGSMTEDDVAATGPGEAILTLESLLVSPTRGRAGLRVGGVDDPTAWEPLDVTARHGSTILQFGGNQSQGDGTTFSLAYSGVDDARGTWIVTVAELVGPQVGDESQRIQGPWTMTLDLP
jgi:hypothetical protein